MRGPVVKAFAPLAHTRAATCFPSLVVASPSTASPPSPKGIRGTGTEDCATEAPSDATVDKPAAVGLVGTMRVTVAWTMRSASSLLSTTWKRSLTPTQRARLTTLATKARSEDFLIDGAAMSETLVGSTYTVLA